VPGIGIERCPSPPSPRRGITTKTKRSLADASHPRPNLRAPLPSSYLVLHPYGSHRPSHRVPTSTTQTPYWRASSASRLSARSHEPQVFIKPSKRWDSPHIGNKKLSIAPNVWNRFSLQHAFSDTKPDTTPGATAHPLLPPYPLLFPLPPLRISSDSLGRTPVLSPAQLSLGDGGLLPSPDARSVRDEHRPHT